MLRWKKLQLKKSVLYLLHFTNSDLITVCVGSTFFKFGSLIKLPKVHLFNLSDRVIMNKLKYFKIRLDLVLLSELKAQ